MQRRTFLRSAMAAAAVTSWSPARAVAGWYRVVDTPPDLDAVRGDGSQVVVTGAAVKDLQDATRGRILMASTDGYDTARQVLNPSIDKRPALIAQPTGVADVRHVVQFAHEHHLLTAVKCGGHSFSGMSTCDGGLMIDLSAMRGVRVDPKARRAFVEGGTLLGLLDHEAMAHGLVTPMGTVSHTGVGGLTTGGGFGRLARRWGLALDNLTAVDVVTADGTFHHATAEENADLFWGVRGAGGNFGVVTGFEFQLHPMDRQVIAGELVFPRARARDLLTVLADYSPVAPDDLQLDFVMAQPPGGREAVSMFAVCYSGPPADADRVLAPLRKLGTPLQDGIRAMDYVAVQRSGDVADPRAMGFYMKSGFVPDISAGLVEAMLAEVEVDPRRGVLLFTQQSGGAINRVTPDAAAFPHRDAAHNLLLGVNWKTGDDAASHVAWGRERWVPLEPFTNGWYTNEVADETGEAINANYRRNYERLVALKNRYDPDNLFRLNANVQPTVRA
jgi:FAD/FMN-containing dehydrogenase